MKVIIVCPDHVLASGLTGVIDVLNVANTLAKKKVFEWQVVGLSGEMIRSSQGNQFKSDVSLLEIDACDAMIWIGSQFQGSKDLWRRCQKVTALRPQISKVINDCDYVLAACTGVSYLATCHHFERQKLTSSWWLKTFYQTYFPTLNIEQDATFIHDGKYITAGAALCYFPMALYFVSQVVGQPLADSVASWLAIPNTPASQRPFMVSHALEHHTDEKLLALQQEIKHSPGKQLGVAELAKKLCVSERTLIRRFHKHIGLSPSGYVRLVRLEYVKHCLITTNLSLTQISDYVGYRDPQALNKQFKYQYGKTMSAFRRQNT